MPIPTSVIEALQRAGAAVFEADAQVQALAQQHAQQVQAAVLNNPFHLGNDSLFDNWKTVARMAQTLSGMEQELRKLYQLAGDLAQERAQERTPAPVPVLAAPLAAAPIELVQSIQVTDVRIKKPARPAKPRRRAATVAPRQSGRASGAVRGNAARLLAYLATRLNGRGFAPINQSAASQATGIPLGSMSAAMKKLLAERLIAAGAHGGYKFLG